MVTDHEKVLAQLKAKLREKDTWGRRQVLELIGELEGENLTEEDLPERALRLYGSALRDRLVPAPDESPSGAGIAGASANGSTDQSIQ